MLRTFHIITLTFTKQKKSIEIFFVGIIKKFKLLGAAVLNQGDLALPGTPGSVSGHWIAKTVDGIWWRETTDTTRQPLLSSKVLFNKN